MLETHSNSAAYEPLVGDKHTYWCAGFHVEPEDAARIHMGNIRKVS